MHILIIVGKFPQLSETFIFRKVAALASHGFQVTVAARDPGSWECYKDIGFPENVNLRYLVPDSNVLRPKRLIRVVQGILRLLLKPHYAYLFLRRLLRLHVAPTRKVKLFLRYVGFFDLRPELIHFEFLGLPVMYRCLPEFLNTPYVVSCRGSDLNLFLLRPPDQQQIIRESLLGASIVHTVSEAMAEVVRSITSSDINVCVNRPAIDTAQYKISPQTTGTPIILATGRLVWIKGFDYLLAALAQLNAEGIQFTAKILGDGPLHAVLKFSIYDMGLEGCVELCGAVPPRDVIQYMQQASIFVLSSHEEGISNAVLEAMASGLPIVTTNAGGMAEAVRDGIDGFVVPVREIDALADRLRALLLDPDLRSVLGKNARARAIEEYDLERQVTMFEQIYRSATSSMGY